MSSLPRWMHVRLSVRFILMTLLLLVLIQTVGFWIVQGAVERYVREDIQHSISVSERVWNKLIIQNHLPN